jgi:hypothetical protein
MPSEGFHILSASFGRFDFFTKQNSHDSQPKQMRVPSHHFRIWIPFIATLWLCVSAFGQEGLKVGMKAPDFELPAVGGKKIGLREFQNKKIVIVHFWKSK